MFQEMCDIMKEAYKRGWITSKDGNVSYRDGKMFFITPSGAIKYNLAPGSLLSGILDLDTPFPTIDWDQKDQTPSGEFMMHFNLQLFQEKGTVLHLHPTYTIAAMYRGVDLQGLAKEFPELSRYTRVGKTVPKLPICSEELARETVISFTDNKTDPNLEYSFLNYDIVGQAQHGVTAIGKTPHDAFDHIERLEHICQIALASV